MKKPMTNSSKAEFFIECKMCINEDPFIVYDELPTGTEAKDSETLSDLISKRPGGPAAVLNIGQLTAYVITQMGSQYQTHVFLVFILKCYARLFCWDHSGTVFTAPIYYNCDSHLFDFFARYNYASPKARGHDMTVSTPTPDEEWMARTMLGLEASETLSTISMPNQGNTQELCRYVVCTPVPDVRIPPGHSTCTSIIYNVLGKERVLLKDTWWVDIPDILPEGVVYGILHNNGIPNVSHCSQAGDVGDNVYHATQTNQLADKSWKPNIEFHLTPHWHYRLVLNDIGENIDEFSKSKDMVTAVHAALIGKINHNSQIE